MAELHPISTTTLWMLVSAGPQPTHFANDEDEWQCQDCRKWRPRWRFDVYEADETTSEFKATKAICAYCAQERVLNWVDPTVVPRLKDSIDSGHVHKNVTANAQFSTAKLRRVTYSNGDTVEELILRRPPNT